MGHEFFKPKPPGYKPPPPTVVVRNMNTKKVTVSFTIGEENLSNIQNYYNGTCEEALIKFLESQLSGQCKIDTLNIGSKHEG